MAIDKGEPSREEGDSSLRASIFECTVEYELININAGMWILDIQ